MRSVKLKLFSLAAAAALVLTLGGCAVTTPATVGTIGGVEIPAGIYLLAQYNAYNTASGLADLATGESASNVKAVLKAECTGTIGDEELSTVGAVYIEKLTTRAIEYYAAVESKFEQMSGTLSEDAVSEAAENAESLWSTNGELYEANGISEASVEKYLLNAQKARAILNLTYGENGTDPVTTEDYENYINDECYYIESVQLPLLDYTSYSFADDDQTAEIESIAAECLEYLQTADDSDNALYTAAMTYVPQAYEALSGSTMETAQAVYYASSQLYTPDDLSSYGGDDYNNLTDPLDEAGTGNWTTINLGTGLLVARRINPLDTYTVEQLNSSYDLLTAMKSEQVQGDLYAEGAALEHALDASAIKTYSASKIKKTV